MISFLRLRLFSRGTASAPGVYRDDAVMEDAGERLRALGLFTEVYVGGGPDEIPAPADRSYAVAWLWVDSSADVEVFAGSSLAMRQGMFGLAIEVRDQSPLERARRLSRLESEAKNALQGKRLANACYPGSVKVARQGRDYTVNHPSVRSVFVGKYRFPVGGGSAHDDSDRESAWN